MKSVFIVCALLVCAPAIAMAQTQTSVLKISYTMTSTFEKAGTIAASFTSPVTRYVAPNGTVRTETTDHRTGDVQVEITSESEDYHIVIDEKNKMATRVNGLFRGMHTGTVGTQGTKADIGPALTQGYACEGYANILSGGVTIKQWVCKDPASGVTFPGRIEASHGNSQTVTAITKIERNQVVSTGLFEIPHGYTVAESDAKFGIKGMTMEPTR
jgi:hypothetical protein